MGTTLVLLFINDLPLLLKYCYADFFADDGTVHKSSPSIDVINEEMLTDFLTIVSWSKRNKLPINYYKTTYMILGARRHIQDAYDLALNVDNLAIEKVSKQSFWEFLLMSILLGHHISIIYVQLFQLKYRFLSKYRHMCDKT